MQSTDARVRLGRYVTSLRQAREWNQSALARELGERLGKKVDPTTITRMERGNRPTTVDEILAMSEIFGVSPTSFLPPEGVIGDLYSKWKVELDSLERRRGRLEIEVIEVRTQSSWYRSLVRAGEVLTDYTRDGTTDGLCEAVVSIATAIDRGQTWLPESVPFIDILREIGVPDDLVLSDEVKATVKNYKRPHVGLAEIALSETFPEEWSRYVEWGEQAEEALEVREWTQEQASFESQQLTRRDDGLEA